MHPIPAGTDEILVGMSFLPVGAEDIPAGMRLVPGGIERNFGRNERFCSGTASVPGDFPAPLRELLANRLGIRAVDFGEDIESAFSEPNGFVALTELMQRERLIE
jgi:hypothetical protein